MQITFDTEKITDANAFGELLRDYCFVPDKNGGDHGCYSTFDLRPEFKRLEGKEAEDFIEKFLRSEDFWGDWYKAANLDPKDYEMQLETFNNFMRNIYTNGRIIISWYWDSDGILLIGEKGRIAYNSDCKCSYNWEWMR